VTAGTLRTTTWVGGKYRQSHLVQWNHQSSSVDTAHRQWWLVAGECWQEQRHETARGSRKAAEHWWLVNHASSPLSWRGTATHDPTPTHVTASSEYSWISSSLTNYPSLLKPMQELFVASNCSQSIIISTRRYCDPLCLLAASLVCLLVGSFINIFGAEYLKRGLRQRTNSNGPPRKRQMVNQMVTAALD